MKSNKQWGLHKHTECYLSFDLIFHSMLKNRRVNKMNNNILDETLENSKRPWLIFNYECVTARIVSTLNLGCNLKSWMKFSQVVLMNSTFSSLYSVQHNLYYIIYKWSTLVLYCRQPIYTINFLWIGCLYLDFG